MTFDEYKKAREGKRIDYDKVYGFQCVDQARHFAEQVHGAKIKPFWGSARAWWQSWSPFLGLPYVRVRYDWIAIPPRGAIIFFKPTKTNPYGHVAVTGKCNNKELWVIEQNAGQGDGDGKWWDEITIRNYPYKGAKVWDCVGWFVKYQEF